MQTKVHVKAHKNQSEISLQQFSVIILINNDAFQFLLAHQHSLYAINKAYWPQNLSTISHFLTENIIEGASRNYLSRHGGKTRKM